jgi:hypothetical protein
MTYSRLSVALGMAVQQAEPGQESQSVKSLGFRS